MKVAERATLLEGGRLKWIRKATKCKTGGPRIILPAEMKSWAGCEVEIEILSPREVVLRLIDEGGDKK